MTSSSLTASRNFSSGVDYIQTLLEGLSWTGTSGTAVTVGYNFDISYENGAVLSSDGRAAALQAMGSFSNVANISFAETSASAATLTFSQKELGAGTLGLTSTLFSDTTIAASEVVLDDDYSSLVGGTDAFLTLLHELGHAVGLKHTAQESPFDVGPFLPSAEDNNNFTVMSYNQGSVANFSNPPVTPMIYDIAALQFLYGANTSFNATGTGYSFDGSLTAQTIWDAGGTDVISAEGYVGGGSVRIDLREGGDKYTQIGSSYVWNAFGANIESGVANNANDTLYGKPVRQCIISARWCGLCSWRGRK